MQGSKQTLNRAQQKARWRMARMTAVLLLLGFLQASAQLTAQTVTLNANKMPLEKVCKEIEKQTGYFFVYAKDLEKSQPVTVQLKNDEVKSALDKVFGGSALRYELIGKVVSVNTNRKNETPASPKETTSADTINVTGHVITEKGPLENASVSTTISKKSTLTDRNGLFSIRGANPKDEIVVSYVGYKTARQKAGRDKEIIFALQVADNELDKVVVKAYGTTTKRFATSTITSISGKDIENIPVQNPLLALNGRVPGLVVKAASGDPFSPVKVEVRGRNSVNPNFPSDPLYVIDGVPQTILNLAANAPSYQQPTVISPGLNQANMGMAISPLFGLNPSDIESIEVLQDAGATAVYGSRGANGVILITTRRGKAGRTSLNVNMAQGVNYITKYYDMLSTTEYLAMRREAFANDGLTPNKVQGTPGYAPDLFYWDTTRNVNWQKYLWGNPGYNNRVGVSVSGGNDQMTFRLSGGYSKTKDIKAVSGFSKSFSVQSAFDYKSIDKKFTMALTAMMVNTSSDVINMRGDYWLPPHAPDPIDEKGNLNFDAYRLVPNYGGNSFPWNSLKTTSDMKSSQLNANLELGYTILKGLRIGTSIQMTQGSSDTYNTRPLSSRDRKDTSEKYANAYSGNTRMKNFSIEPFVELNKAIGNGQFTARMTGTYQHNTTTSIGITGNKYTSDDMLYSILGAPEKDVVDRYGEYKYAGGMITAGYVLSNRYMADLVLRRDGNSRFGPGKQYGNFGSLGVGWIVTEEEWAQKVFPKFLTFLKPSVNYGLTGSDAVGEYQYLTQWGPLLDGSGKLASYDGVSPVVSQLQANNDYHWSTSRQLNVSLTIGLINRINVTLTAFRNRTNDQLVSFPTGLYTGFQSVTANSPADVQNTGWSVLVNATAIRSKNFNWDVSFNTSYQKNKLLGYPNLELSPYANSYKIGQSTNLFYMYKYLGVDPATGRYMFVDQNKDGLILTEGSVPAGTGTDDRVIGTTIMPDFTGNMNHSFRYRNLSLNLNFSMSRFDAKQLTTGNIGEMRNIGKWEYDNRWTTPGQHAAVSKLTTKQVQVGEGGIGVSDGQYLKTSFIRLADANLGYGLPLKLAKKMGMQSMTIGLSGNNIFLLTGYKGIDPESPPAGVGMPPSRALTLTLNCNL